jgi:transcriptional regulator with XRE-family HTH domain
MDSLADLGKLVREFRTHRGLTQETLAESVGGPSKRTAVALLEQGRRLPSSDILTAIIDALGIPRTLLGSFMNDRAELRFGFETEISELVGRPVALQGMSEESVRACEESISQLFSKSLSPTRRHSWLNTVLVYYGVPGISLAFYDLYLSEGALQSLDSLREAVRGFQRHAIRLYSTFAAAFRHLNSADDPASIVGVLKERPLKDFYERTEWGKERVKPLPEDQLEFLGYISVGKYRQQRKKRELLSTRLRDLASAIQKKGKIAVDEMSEKRKRQIDSLLKELGTSLSHTPLSSLFAPNVAELEAEANRVLRKVSDEETMELAQRQALENLSHYLSSDYMDVYVATSMRTESDFISVNRFVEKLFSHADVEPLRLRYFNPTQSWIEDRVAKGLVEALMLRRSLVTLYMAQKTDSFGKDSEASVALGQGKAVIVYVPKLTYPDAGLDSEELLATSDARLREILADSYTADELDEFDHDGLFSAALAHKLKGLSDAQMLELVELHWADLALADESERIVARPDEKDSDVTNRRRDYSEFVAGVSKGRKPALRADIRLELEKIICAVVTTFELRRARVFKDVHRWHCK